MHEPVDRSRVVAEMRRRAATYPPDSAQAHWHLAQAEIAELYMIWEMEEYMDEVEVAVEEADDDICGETYGHTLRMIDERDGSRSYECRECGAEILEEDE